ncbi:LuxR C-terminal-related transcriptional regulator [Virgibacillus sp. C22-A2]|uniref:LuxR C-terminal-related transcriptional regulator n=1 Tax=Virgibacillus tibetensis TaxID=3042313 RepID=A0ABU6KCI6_9BACI|nr:LuxR C-terminal-related transcriptional regulator [Virgibacillus sp. C22-A2]
MKQSNELLEELIDIYARRYELSVLITDDKGELLLPAKGNNTLFNTLIHVEQDDLYHKIKENINDIGIITRPLFYELWPGIYTIVAPITNQHYLWAGLLLQEDTQQLISNQLQNTASHIDWVGIVENTPVMNETKKIGWQQWMNKLVKLTNLCIKEGAGSGFGPKTQVLFEVFQDEDSDMDKLLNKFRMESMEYDFFGLAEKQEEELYQVTSISGNDKMGGARFSLGEGFLGRVLLNNKSEFWESIEKDPRTIFFQRYNLYIKSLFAFPVKHIDGSLALFFGGSVSNHKVSKNEMEVAKIMALILEKNLQTRELRKENTQQLYRLSSLVEVCKLMASIPDYKRILYLLIDISLSLVQGTFASIVLKDLKSEKVQLVSRGSDREQISVYARDVIKRYYRSSLENSFEIGIKKADEYAFPESSIIECPLYYNDALLGVLSVGIDGISEKEVTEQLRFLETLSIMGGVSLQLAKEESIDVEDEKVCSLHHAIEQFDQEAYDTAKKAAKIAGDFAGKQGLTVSAIKDIIQTCQLSIYSYDFIKMNVESENIAAIAGQGKSLLEKKDTTKWQESTMEVKLFTLAYSYAKENDLREIAVFKQVDDMVKEFINFIHESQVVEEEISLTEDILNNQELLSVTSTVKQLKLSPREQEVLELVIEGLNNREIAEELFISGHTVKNHVTKIFRKLEVPDRAHAISKVYQMKYKSG